MTNTDMATKSTSCFVYHNSMKASSHSDLTFPEYKEKPSGKGRIRQLIVALDGVQYKKDLEQQTMEAYEKPIFLSGLQTEKSLRKSWVSYSLECLLSKTWKKKSMCCVPINLEHCQRGCETCFWGTIPSPDDAHPPFLYSENLFTGEIIIHPQKKEPTDVPSRLCYTPNQVKAIVNGMGEGLTLISGPLGTGKTARCRQKTKKIQMKSSSLKHTTQYPSPNTSTRVTISGVVTTSIDQFQYYMSTTRNSNEKTRVSL
uniref:AlNc14C186G8332 protein n=1 Tax=Albugo laibachii Nc14 TaxID=890382 RepID=F0WPI7_9STRA|nr:AlNc14C186G8332 [Albugo laibachii Nc14]|eukprot:CCA23235.1 AlNc14C186G8332 [Albugo laibachii Nc14]